MQIFPTLCAKLLGRFQPVVVRLVLSLNVLQHRFTTRPFVVALMGAQAVTHRHADHIIAVPNPVRSQAVAIAE